ncbi:hypothetical protein [Epilithonimonas sp.]|uniref:hypothetical protein n=1 Tax=Epilithonimonas sp. TaxID=2894511 RepID=UPI0035AFD3E8
MMNPNLTEQFVTILRMQRYADKSIKTDTLHLNYEHIRSHPPGKSSIAFYGFAITTSYVYTHITDVSRAKVKSPLDYLPDQKA